MHKKISKQDSHEFSLYFPTLSELLVSKKAGQYFSIDDDTLYHRMMRVLRFGRGEQFVLFDRRVYARFQLESFDTECTVRIQLLEKKITNQLKPAIIFFLPILKRDALEQAIYSLVELGATEVYLMITEKIQRVWRGKKELDRLQTIMIAAAEQSKQYCIPEVYAPKPLSDCLSLLHEKLQHAFFFDPDGKELFPVIELLRKRDPKEILLMIGPEGDLTIKEKQMLQEKGFTFCKLTPTILRAQQAIAVSLGIFRSLQGV